MRKLSIVIFSPSGRFDAALEASAEVGIRERLEDLDDLVESVASKRPEALLVSLEGDAEAAFEALDKLLAPKPLLFFHGPDDSRLILRAMRSGACEYVAPGPDEPEQLLRAIRRTLSEAAGAESAQRASLLPVIGAKGGVGATFVACQVAAALARQGGRTALVDGHLRHGDVSLYLDLQPRYDFASLAAHEGPVDVTYLHTALLSHQSGVAVLAAPQDPEEAETVSLRCVESVLELVREEFDWVVWDAPHDFDDRTLRVLDQSTQVLLVSTPDVPSLNHTRMQLELLARLGHRENGVRVVLNRTGSTASVSLRDAKQFLKRSIDASLPNDYRLASTCVNEGRTMDEVATRSPLDRSLVELARLAHAWCGRPLAERPRRGLLDRLRGR